MPEINFRQRGRKIKFMKQFGSSIERVEGTRDLKKQEAVLGMMKKRFQEQEFKELEDIEREKTPKEAQIIHIVDQVTNHLRKCLGLNEFDLPARNVHIIKEDG